MPCLRNGTNEESSWDFGKWRGAEITKRASETPSIKKQLS
jgi:hypothetical protein